MSRSDLPWHSRTVARAVVQVGDTWTLVSGRDMVLGTRRFDTVLRWTGMASHLLSQRLKKLEGQGVIRRKPYSERPLRREYRLTEKGRDLWTVIIALKHRGDRWLSTEDTPLQIVHKTCGKLARPQLTCPECGEPMGAHDADARLSHRIELEQQAARRAP